MTVKMSRAEHDELMAEARAEDSRLREWFGVTDEKDPVWSLVRSLREQLRRMALGTAPENVREHWTAQAGWPDYALTRDEMIDVDA
jgi:hypothetical protein